MLLEDQFDTMSLRSLWRKALRQTTPTKGRWSEIECSFSSCRSCCYYLATARRCEEKVFSKSLRSSGGGHRDPHATAISRRSGGEAGLAQNEITSSSYVRGCVKGVL